MYVPNEPEEVMEIPDFDLTNITVENYPSKNLYNYIIDRGFKNVIGKGHGVTCLRTGYNPGKQRKHYLELKKDQRLGE